MILCCFVLLSDFEFVLVDCWICFDFLLCIDCFCLVVLCVCGLVVVIVVVIVCLG